MNESAKTTSFQHLLRVADLPTRKATRFDIVPDADARARIAAALDLLELRKLRLAGSLEAQGRDDWRLEATLGATVVQPCVVTLAPVVTRIDTPVTRHFMSELPDDMATGDEVELPEDENLERLGSEIDLGAVLVEALALALPLYPRADDAELGEARFAEPGVTPMRDEDARPFAGLAGLRDKLAKDD